MAQITFIENRKINVKSEIKDLNEYLSEIVQFLKLDSSHLSFV